MQARCVLLRLRCNRHSLLLSSYLSRIGRIKNSSCSACGHFSSHSTLSSDGLFVFLRPLVQALGSCPASGAPWSSAMPLSLGRGRVTTTTTTGSKVPFKWVMTVEVRQNEKVYGGREHREKRSRIYYPPKKSE